MRHLKIESLPKSNTWIDRDIIMLHSCFQLLKDFVEKENGDTHCNYEVHKDFVDEVRFLYKWWKDREVDDDVEDDKMLIRLLKIRLMLWT